MLFVALKRTRGCSVPQYLSQKLKRKPAAFHIIIYKNPVPKEEDDSRINCLFDIQPMIEMVTNYNTYNDNNGNIITI